jgi:hypothetical protein
LQWQLEFVDIQEEYLRMNRRIWSGSFWERKRRSSVSSRWR